jgi:hypothetical protein
LDGIDLKRLRCISDDIDDIGLFALLATYHSAKKESLMELKVSSIDPTGELPARGILISP